MFIYHKTAKSLIPVVGGGAVIDTSLTPIEDKFCMAMYADGYRIVEREYTTEDEGKAGAESAINAYAAKLEAGGIVIIVIEEQDF